jgi:hypothetical protein
LTEAVLQQCKAEVTGDGEDDDARQPNLKRVQEKMVHVERPAEDEIVYQGEDSGCR